MSAFLSSLSTAAKIGSPIALLAFIAVLIFWHRARTLKADWRELKALPLEVRAEVLLKRQNHYGLTAERLSERDARDFMINESNLGARNARDRLYVSAAVFVICFVTVVIAGPWEENSRSKSRPPRPTARAGRAPQGNVQLTLTFATAGMPGDARLEVEVAYGSNHDQAWDIQELQSDWMSGRVVLELPRVGVSGKAYARLRLLDKQGKMVESGEWGQFDVPEN